MIRPPAGWTHHFGAHLTTLYPPQRGGRIRFYERIRPLQTFSQVIRFVLERDASFRVTSIFKPREIITSEGEYGAYVRLNGVRANAAETRFVGVVFADEFAAALDGLVVVAEQSALIERTCHSLLSDCSFGLGIRRRRFLYAEPVAWQALQNGLVSNWYPPGFPKDHTNIVVMPAEPIAEAAPPTFESMLAAEQEAGVSMVGDVSQSDIVSIGQLTGTRWSFAIRRRDRTELFHRELVRYVCPPYTYVMRMETTSSEQLADHRETFLAVARSAMPIPVPGQRRIDHDAFAVFSHMSE